MKQLLATPAVVARINSTSMSFIFIEETTSGEKMTIDKISI